MILYHNMKKLLAILSITFLALNSEAKADVKEFKIKANDDCEVLIIDAPKYNS